MKPHLYTVSELTGKIKFQLETNFPSLGVVGEISNLRRPSSGHLYFTLKDDKSQLPVVLFREAGGRVPFELRDGIEVIIWGRITVYSPRGNYQLIANLLEPKGLGALQLALEQLKAKLSAEGLFAEELKKPLPRFPTGIGLVTSPTGAAIRDILNVLDYHAGEVRVVLNPVRVQGEGAAKEIARAVGELNRLGGIDVIIAARGGGSLEDLWAFNEEPVVRAIFASRIPVVSAVGHEIDWTLADLAADVRAATPTAAAELIAVRKEEQIELVSGLKRRGEAAIAYRLEFLRHRLLRAVESAVVREPERLYQHYRQQVDELSLRLGRLLEHRLELARRGIESRSAQLESLSPLSVMARGYGFTRRMRDGKIIREARKLKRGEKVETRLWRGSFTSEVTGIK